MEKREVAFFIDDDKDFLQLIPYMVQDSHFDILTHHSENGYQAIDEIIRVKPDVLFIDFHLPPVNGGQIVSIIKSIQALSDMPVYFITGYPKDQILPFLEGVRYEKILSKSESFKEDVVQILKSKAI